MEELGTYTIIIASTIIIIMSYFFNILARKTNIPSVLMLIVLGIIIKQVLDLFGHDQINFFPILEIIGVVGLIMIVLEAALDLEIKRSKLPMIIKSFSVALISLILSSYIIALILQAFLRTDMFISLLYAVPLSIMSSAILIPSIKNIHEDKKEFLIYESTFSDILGIMFFYFILGSVEAESASEIGLGIASNISITIGLSIALSIALLYVFQNLKSEIKLFLLISVLILLYAVGKYFHLSSLIIILVFGLMLRNRYVIFKRFLNRIVKPDALTDVFNNLNLVTMETSFVIRTFFFVIFGISISLLSLLSFNVFLISILVLLVLFGIRFLILKLFIKKEIFPQIFLAPRGLITILLFYAIPQNYVVEEFEPGILLFVILVTSVLMAYAIIKDSKTPIIDETLEGSEIIEEADLIENSQITDQQTKDDSK